MKRQGEPWEELSLGLYTCQGILVHNIIAVSGRVSKSLSLYFHLTTPFSFPARSLQEFATVLRNLEDERIRMVSMAGLPLVMDSVIIEGAQGLSPGTESM